MRHIECDAFWLLSHFEWLSLLILSYLRVGDVLSASPSPSPLPLPLLLWCIWNFSSLRSVRIASESSVFDFGWWYLHLGLFVIWWFIDEVAQFECFRISSEIQCRFLRVMNRRFVYFCFCPKKNSFQVVVCVCALFVPVECWHHRLCQLNAKSCITEREVWRISNQRINEKFHLNWWSLLKISQQ